MAKVQVLNVSVLDNPSPFGNPFQFEITFECMEDLPEGERCHTFTRFTRILQLLCKADAPNTGLIPESDAVGVTVVLITCTYRGQEFIRIGYYVNNEYTDPELRENPPVKPNYTQ
ncbi:histone chaperone asf1b-B-like, partial [Sinocyclocheilus grahami]|uniref:histone chaperone asf1b-B-like n=1 Tax=Sinocyclocheilus grahami TaxID=75366 RepID=UPI0007AC53D2